MGDGLHARATRGPSQDSPALRGNRKGTGCGKRIAPTLRAGFGHAASLSRGRLRRPPILRPVALAGDRDDVSVMDQSVEDGGREDRIGKHFAPEFEGLVRGSTATLGLHTLHRVILSAATKIPRATVRRYDRATAVANLSLSFHQYLAQC